MTTIPPETEFLIKHGQNTSERLVNDILEAIAKTLVDHGIIYNGKNVQMKVLGKLPREDQKLIIDVKNPDETFDHIEFCVTKTGWGRAF